MICPKCHRKYEDDMPKCIWCDEPRPEITPEQEISEEAPSPDTGKGSVKGTNIFWMAVILGPLGVHCFMSKRILRGILYIVFGGFLAGFINGYFGKQVFSESLRYVFFALALIVNAFILIDIWEISKGTYTHKITGISYTGAKWMKVLFFVFLIFWVPPKIVAISRIGKDPTAVDIESPLVSKSMTYVEKQEEFFASQHRLGKASEIGFEIPKHKITDILEYKDIGSGLLITSRTSSPCPFKSFWVINANIEDDKLVWRLILPEDENCNSKTQKIKEFKEKIESKL